MFESVRTWFSSLRGLRGLVVQMNLFLRVLGVLADEASLVYLISGTDGAKSALW